MHTLKFVHIRPRSRQGGYERCGGLTIAFFPPPRAGDKVIQLAIASCSKNDAFCKEIGRNTAITKFENGEFLSLTIDPTKPIGGQLKEAFYPIMRLAVPYDNEEKHNEQRMYKSGQKSEQRKQRRLQIREQAERQSRQADKA